MKIIDRKIKKYQNIIDTLKENKKNREAGDIYNYDVDIMNTKWVIADLKAIKKEDETVKRISDILKSKEEVLTEVLALYEEYNSGSKKYTLSEIDKKEIEVKAQISVLRYLISE